ncbi:MAG: phenylalanine--tRNA ligase subunit beta [Cycloclasticus sp. symbiont of Bathymodiolus heckerae]|nr:MAG: phenylalanine--tRNA ligase subunit beta [Cycloclasticus sp. symbiont of Bathymodiolus heckerae]
MLVNEAWLKEFVNYSMPIDELTAKLTMAGLEVDSVEPAAAEFSGVVVGEVLSVEAHPNADKLRLCKVSVGSETLDIVCGASNVREGLRIPVATVGAVLPGNFKIKPSKLRGEPSNGMLCSEEELGLADSADGLMELPADAPIGDNIRDYLQLDDTIIEVDLTPNRADCLSIEGVAREIACFTGEALIAQSVGDIAPTIDDVVSVKVDVPEDCPRYLGRVIKGLDRSVPTPIWMQEKLRRCGERSLGPLVDVTNYVLLELGQPLHTFDLNKIDGDIVVRRARSNEILELLNEQKIELDDDVLLIADEHKALAFAGVMGGAQSAVNDETTDIFLECAFFTPISIAGKSRKFGLHTDASHRFERGVDPELCYRALNRAIELLTSIAGGEVGPLTDATSANTLPTSNVVPFRYERIQRVLGVQLDEDVVESYFTSLGMTVEKSTGEWLVTAPSYRFDMAIEADLIEEVARLYGYDNLPQNSLNISGSLASVEERKQPLDRIKDLLVDLGYQEAITYSFTDEKSLELLTPNADVYKLQNPISSDLSTMRTTLWAGLLKVMDANIKRNEETVRFFETGLTFVVENGTLKQEQVLAMLATGQAQPEQWGDASRAIDFYDVKHDVESILALNGLAADYQFKSGEHNALHPGQTAELTNSVGEHVGYIGLLHPALESDFDIKKPVYLVELKQQFIQIKDIPVFHAVSKYPPVRRDLALIVDEKLHVNEIVDYIYKQYELVNEVIVFDIYQGKGIETGRKSVALGLILQDKSKTLVEQEVEELIATLLKSISALFDAQLRE